jgi:hypothetical protein
MKRNLITILSLVVMSLMFNATGAYAQSFAKADVPFAFNVGTAQLPAGTYEVKVLSSSPYEIMIQNHQTSAAAVASARREGSRDAESKLVFHRIANQYFLTEVWKGSEAGRMIVPTSRHERELTKELRLAKGPSSASENVTIALK